MKIIADTHVHTIASEHAMSTVMENIQEAKRKGLRFLAITDHTGRMIGAPSEGYFICLKSSLPEEYDGIQLIRGCEVNILDTEGTLDLSESNLKRMEWVIASVHSLLCAPMTVEESTTLWLNVAKNPLVDVIGHCGDKNFRFNYERVVPEFAKYGKIVEINASSYRTRPTSRSNCVEIARLCAKYGVPIVLSSDAHFAGNVGNVEEAIRIVTEANIPEELILNTNYSRFAAKLTEITGRTFPIQ